MNTAKQKNRITSTDYTRPHRPALLSLLNSLGSIFSRTTKKNITLDQEKLIHKAIKKTGLNYLGDTSLPGRLKLYLESIEKESRLHFAGRIMVQQNTIRILANRLMIENHITENPVTDIQIEDPVFIIGLQRTGTTKLHRLLSRDSDHFRYLASWEAAHPASLGIPHERDINRRIAMAVTARRALQYMAPDFFAIHPVDVTGPEEDCLLFDYGFWSTVPEATMRVPSYSHWLELQDHTEAYRFYKTMLQYLYRQNPRGRWVLKTPQHMEHVEELFTVFPDAKIIHTHRDPARVIASFCSMISHAYGIFSDTINPVEIGKHWLAKAHAMVRNSMAIRKKIGSEHFIDIHYHDLLHDPFSIIRQVYTFLGLSFGDKDYQRIMAWEHNNPQHKYGQHRYRLEDFGLNRKMIQHQFAEYISFFNIPEERDDRTS